MEKKVQKNMNVFTCSKQVMCPKTSTRRIPIQFQFVCFFSVRLSTYTYRKFNRLLG